MEEPCRIGWQIRVISNLIKREVGNSGCEQYRDELTGNNMFIIGYLAKHRNEDVFQKDLEEVFMVRRSTMSAVLLRMEEKGLLKRTSVEHDARLKKITLTEKGMQLYQKMEHSIDNMEGRMISGLSPEEEATLLSLLEKVRTNLENEKS